MAIVRLWSIEYLCGHTGLWWVLYAHNKGMALEEGPRCPQCTEKRLRWRSST